ncbi:DJ-1/PfpI family protein, partial [candidate division KSB1 bacterium]|nr:DJ-1/PfpI family protein [candidate division KSB1 bacterium]
MSANIDVLNPSKPKRVLLVVANPSESQTTGWPIGFWAAEMTHPHYEFTEKGYQVDVVSPQGGKVQLDSFSDPRDASGYSAHDLISMGFLNTPKLAALLENTKSIAEVKIADYDALFLAGGQSPMYTFIDDAKLHKFVADFYE